MDKTNKMENEAEFLPEDERIQLEYLESLLTNLTTKNVEKVVRKIKNIQFKTRNQLQYLSDLIFKFVHERPDKIKEYAYLCGQIKDLKVTILRFETIDEKESLEIANLRFHILLTTRVEIGYDQLGAVKDSFQLFSDQKHNDSLVEVLRFLKNQLTFAGELYKHDLVTTEFLFASMNRLSLMAEMSEFFLECMVSLMEQIAKDVEAKNYSMGRYFKQLRNIARNNGADIVLMERIKSLLKLRATKWLGGEGEVPLEYVENLAIDENYKQKALRAIKEELAKYIFLNRCRSCCLEFNLSDRIYHLTSKQHTLNIQTLLRDQYDGNLISCRDRSCIICQEVDIEKPFVHFNTQEHKIKSTTFCYICQTKFTSAFYLSMHLKSLNHRKEILRVYDSILETTLLSELVTKENDILASDASDDDDNCLLNYEKYDRFMNENTMLKNNIFKYLDLITTEDRTKDQQGLHGRVMEQLDRFIENIYISKNISTENTLELLKQFNQEVEDVKAAVKCVKGDFSLVSESEKAGIAQEHNLVNLLKDQYAELCEDMKKKLADLNKVTTEYDVKSDNLLDEGNYRSNDDHLSLGENNTFEEECHNASMCNVKENRDTMHNQNFREDKETFNVKNTRSKQENFIPTENIDLKSSKRISDNSTFLGSDISTSNDLETKLTQCNMPKEEGWDRSYETLNICPKSSSSTIPEQFNIGTNIENINLSAAYGGVESSPTGDNSNEKTGDTFRESLGKTIEKSISELKISNNKEYFECRDTKKSQGRPYGKNKRTNLRDKCLEIEKCTNLKSRMVQHAKRKSNNLSYDCKTTSTTKWHIMNHSVESLNQQSEKITIKVESNTNNQKLSTTAHFEHAKGDNSCIKNTSTDNRKDQFVNTPNTSSTTHKEDASSTSKLVESYNINHNVTRTKTPSNVDSLLPKDTSNVDGGNHGTTSQENSFNETVFNLKKIKFKIFAKLKRKIPEKLRSEVQSLDAEKLVIEVTSFIKKVYMSEDVPLGLTLGLFENFNKDLELRIKDQKKSSICI